MIGIVVKCFGKKMCLFCLNIWTSSYCILQLKKKYYYNRLHIVFLMKSLRLVQNDITARINIIWYFDSKILSSRLYGR